MTYQEIQQEINALTYKQAHSWSNRNTAFYTSQEWLEEKLEIRINSSLELEMFESRLYKMLDESI